MSCISNPWVALDVEQYGLKVVQGISTSYRPGTRDMDKQPESRNAKAAKLPGREADRVKVCEAAFYRPI